MDNGEQPRGIDDTVEHPDEIVQQTPPEGDPRPWISRNDEVPGTGKLAEDVEEESARGRDTGA